MRVKLKVDASALSSLDLSGVTNHIMNRVENAFNRDIGPHYVDVAKARAPVSQERNFNPQRGSFQPLKLKPLGSFGPVETGNRAERLFDLAGMSYRERAEALRSSDIEFFEGTGKNKGRTPDAVDIINGTVKGAFKHRPGTLRDSIHIDGVTREGQTVTLRVVASAPYAAAIAKGFTHRGGRGKTGKATKIAPNPFMKSPLANVNGRLKNPSTYR
jgi:hypothetical protein